MNQIRPIRALFAWATALLLVGCAETTVQPVNETPYAGLPRPKQINVYDFAVNPGEVAQNSGPLARMARGPEDIFGETEEQREIAFEVSDALAGELAVGLKAMGFNVYRSADNRPVTTDTLLIMGSFVNIDEGNKARRTLIGLGRGKSFLDTKVSVRVPGAGGYRELFGFDVHSNSGSMPGAAVMAPVGVAAGAGAAAVVATNVAAGAVKGYRSQSAQQAREQADRIVSELSKYFLRQGWIKADQVR